MGRRKRPAAARRPVTTMHAQLSAPVAAKESVQGKGGKRRAKGAHAALIATFHALNKQLAAARARGDAAQATVLADR
eukprot:CAMPEP_0206324636 /NCGR_PEP_ID=MMETSP0106_2-20121207/20628_1 /ASSEMBLY_ACC=CAM_ASM_000206 /TAXON_ID=81532 /ORGANISM="Acanthoeca-like sp., Strain 10tr" /LENGTH=76 /DNA_ID=CAMNT_0053757015 /DNA_START=99 /DNA_END=325 /DNA_ORIENTATION=+